MCLIFTVWRQNVIVAFTFYEEFIHSSRSMKLAKYIITLRNFYRNAKVEKIHHQNFTSYLSSAEMIVKVFLELFLLLKNCSKIMVYKQPMHLDFSIFYPSTSTGSNNFIPFLKTFWEFSLFHLSAWERCPEWV